MKKLITIAFVVLGLSSSVQADPITLVITSGALVGTGFESSSVRATGSSPSGFSFDAGRSFLGGGWGPGICMSGPACSPGSTVDLGSSFSGQEFPGVVTYNGVTYDIGRTSGPPSAMMQTLWMASLPIPLNFRGGTLTTPFTFSGAFYQHGFGGPPTVNLIGSGLLSVEISAGRITSAAYTFVDQDLAPTPEPGTWLLIGTGAALVARVRRRRHA